MALVPPTVGDRLVRCGTSVVVWGIVARATVGQVFAVTTVCASTR
jgi:hypothetical protein